VTTRDSRLPATRAPEVFRNCLLFILSNQIATIYRQLEGA
jgi:hypothetical protein